MNILDDYSQIKKLDRSNVLGSVRQLGLQLEQTVTELKDVEVPADYKNVDKVVVNGMGGSRLGARVTERLFSDNLKIPLIPIGSYDLPSYVDSKTLLILSSYSGNTEEIVMSHKQALERKAKIMIIAQGGKLAQLAKKHNYPGYYGFVPKYNPCNQPRMSIGYQMLSTVILLSKAGLLKVKSKEIDNLPAWLAQIKEKYDMNVSFKDNKAKQLADKAHNYIPVFSAAEFMMGALHVVRNQINENAKQTAVYFETPELNHHLLEGLAFPRSNPKNLYFVYFESELYHPRNIKRIEITKRLLKKNKISVESLKLTGKTQLEQVFELIQFGGFLGFYMSMLNGIDPAPIPWVDYFKKELKNRRVEN